MMLLNSYISTGLCDRGLEVADEKRIDGDRGPDRGSLIELMGGSAVEGEVLEEEGVSE